jgi:hypothetical protein
MVNLVEKKYPYEDAICNCPEKTLYVFECLMEVAGVENGLEIDNLYYSKNLAEAVGGTIPAATLTALVKRGMLHCDGKCEGLNVYAITQEIYDYYKGVYLPTKEAYKKALNTRFWE